MAVQMELLAVPPAACRESGRMGQGIVGRPPKKLVNGNTP